MRNLKQGFTLIELLVVIAIIGILSAVVLASLNTARAKGADANIKSNLANMRSQSEIFYDDNNKNYTGLCSSDNAKAQMDAANLTAGIVTTDVPPVPATVSNDLATAGSVNQSVCHEAVDGSAWAANVPLKTDSANSWCVDSTGISKELTGGYLVSNSTNCQNIVP
jgi:prepilin-type N-terminal cleavage/methylation domain-containing protein